MALNIVFMGTPEFAVESLKMLTGNGHNIEAVFTQPDKPKGRGYALAVSPVKEYATEKGMKVFQPLTLKDEEIQQELKKIAPDVIVVVAYGKILPKAVLDTPRFGCINVHASLLPKLRGAAPIQWAVINGDKTTGITIMQMGEGLDTGDILSQREFSIGEDETSGELFVRLSKEGARLLCETLDELENGNITPSVQEDSEATYAPMITKKQCIIDWNMSSISVHNLVRGLTPFLTASTYLNGKVFKLHSVRPAEDIEIGEHVPGDVIIFDKRPFVVCGCGTIELIEVQLEGKKRVRASDFIRGNKIEKLG